MKEEDYIKAANLTRLNAAKRILTTVFIGEDHHVDTGRFMACMRELDAMILDIHIETE